MTREEAIGELKTLKENYWDDDGYGHETEQYNDAMLALDMAIKALEQEPCGDCVSRQEVLDCQHFIYDEIGEGLEVIFPENVLNLPPVTPQPKTGHWIEKDGFDGDTYYDCSVCGESFCLIDGTPTDNLYNYCPSCGAKMQEE